MFMKNLQGVVPTVISPGTIYLRFFTGWRRRKLGGKEHGDPEQWRA